MSLAHSPIPGSLLLLFLLLQFPLMFDNLFAPAVTCQHSILRHVALVLGILSAWEESAWFGHLVAVLESPAEHEGSSDKAQYGNADDGSVCFPVGGLCVPAAGRRPDVLWVSATGQLGVPEATEGNTYGILPPPPIVMCACADFRCWLSPSLP